MAIKFNPQQSVAIASEQGPVLLSAGAGSGKTAVLTERIVRLCLGGVPVERMLVVTFTNAAAAEMKARIRKRLVQASMDASLDHDLRRRAAEQADLVNRASISTLHAFCGSVLRRYFALVGLDPAFRTADDFESAGMALEACAAVLDRAMAAAEPGFCRLLAGFGGRGGRKLEGLILKGHEFLTTRADPAEYLERARARFFASAHDLKNTAEYRLIIQRYAERCKEGAELLWRAEQLCMEAAPRELLDTTRTELVAIGQGLEKGECELKTLAALNFGTLRLKKTEAFADEIKRLREKAKKLVTAGLEDDLLVADAKYQAELLKKSAPQALALLGLIEDFSREYTQVKRKAGVIDFSDMEQLTIAVLKDEAARSAVSGSYDYVFVDEYQDSSVIQETIIGQIAHAPGLFCVGDVKQSIYRFRGAEPALFLARERRAALGDGVCLPLNVNYRTAAPLLRCVNELFARVMQDELHFGENDALTPGREESPAALSVELLDITSGGDYDAKEREARLTARLIKERKARKLVVNGTEREVKWSDFGVLMRTVSGLSELYCQVFASEGIPVFAELSGGYFDSVEVQVFLSLLRLVENRRNDVALLCVLRSGIGGFEDFDITSIRADAGSCKNDSKEPISYFDALLMRSSGDDATAERCRGLISLLEEARSEQRVLGLTRFCSWLLERTGFEELLLAGSGGPERVANVERLMGRIQSYEGASNRGLSGFLSYVDRAITAGKDMGAATAGGSDCVRLMSIHKSKGLEFPIVYLVNANKQFNLRDAYEQVLFTDSGLNMKAYDHERRLISPTLYHRGGAEAMKRSTINEEQRVLYVALTRAREELTVIGSLKEPEKAAEEYIRGKQPNSFLDMIMTSICRFEESAEFLKAVGIHETGCERHEGRWKVVYHPSGAEEAPAPEGMTEGTFRLWAEAAAHADPTAFESRLFDTPTGGEVPAKQGAKAMAQNEQTAPVRRTPSFVKKRGLSPADVGSAVHILLEHMDFTLPAAPQIEGLFRQEYLTREEADAILPAQVDRFSKSGLCARMLSSKRALREQPFTLPVESEKGMTLVQGVIDACFLEDEKWVIVDYKTDHAKGDPIQAAQKHTGQLKIYAQALTAATGVPVSEAHVYLLSTGDDITIQL